jgi:hypothetical protein
MPGAASPFRVPVAEGVPFPERAAGLWVRSAGHPDHPPGGRDAPTDR